MATYQVKEKDDLLAVARKLGTTPLALQKMNGVRTLTPGQTLKVPRTHPVTPTGSAGGFGGNAAQMSITRGAYRPGGQSTYFAPGPGTGQGVRSQAGVGGSVEGIPNTSGPRRPAPVRQGTNWGQAGAGVNQTPTLGANPALTVTNPNTGFRAQGLPSSYLNYSQLATQNPNFNPQLAAGSYGANAQQIAARPNVQMPSSSIPYSTLAATPPSLLAGVNPTAGTAGVVAPPAPSTPWNGDGVYDGRDINWQRGTSGYGQDFTRGRNRDLRRITQNPAKRAQVLAERQALMASAPQVVEQNNPYLTNTLTWRIST